MVLLSEYCVFTKPYVEEGLFLITKQGSHTSEWNGEVYDNPTDFLDDVVKQIVNFDDDVLIKDIDYAEAFRLSGVVQGYLTATDVMGKVVKDQNPLMGFFNRGG